MTIPTSDFPAAGPADDIALTDQAGHLIRRAHQLAVALFHENLGRDVTPVQYAVLRALEDSGKIPGVARQGSGVAADYKLVMDLRRFESDYSGSATPNAVIELNVKLLHSAGGQDVVASRTFVQSVPAASTAVADVVDAFNRGLGQVAHDVAGWTLVSGDAHQRAAHKK